MRRKVRIFLAADCTALEDKINAFAERHEIENVQSQYVTIMLVFTIMLA